MTFQVSFLPKHLVRVGAVVLFAIGASACSTVPNWVDPTNWIGGSDDQPAPDQTASDQNAQTSDSGQTPDLSTIPDKPNAPSTSDEQRQVAQSLAGDRSRAQYSADALKGGTEPAAAPPSAADATPTEDLASNDNAPAAPPPAAPPDRPSAPGTLPADTSPSDSGASASSAAASSPPPQTQMASLERPPPAISPSAVPAVPAVPALAANMSPSDTTLGFRPSSAPPLDSSVAQFVPASILARYRQTASMGPPAAVPTMTATSDSVEASNLVGDENKPRRHRRATAMGGPESMGGAVVANFDALSVGAAGPSMDDVTGSPAAVVYFSNDTTVLSSEARAQVEATAKAFMAQGAQGYVRVIGHSSGRMGHMTADRYLVWNFERSQARATAVARILIKAGVPADKVLAQAAGEGQSAYQDGDGNRRAEIFFQS